MVSTTTNRVSYTGNNSTSTPYVVTFPLDDAHSSLEITVTTSAGATTTLGSGDFTLTGSNLTTTVAVPASSTLTITRDTAAVQTLDLLPNNPLPANTLEKVLDRLTLAIQDAKNLAQRIVTGSELTFPISAVTGLQGELNAKAPIATFTTAPVNSLAVLDPSGFNNSITLTKTGGTVTSARIAINSTDARTALTVAEAAGVLTVTSGDRYRFQFDGLEIEGVEVFYPVIAANRNGRPSWYLQIAQVEFVELYWDSVNNYWVFKQVLFGGAQVSAYYLLQDVATPFDSDSSPGWQTLPTHNTGPSSISGDLHEGVTATAAQANAAINAAALGITAANTAGNDGSGSIAAVGPVNIAAATAGSPGSIRIVDTSAAWINTSDDPSLPVWKQIT
jgi:hypothetical protein